MRGTTARRDSGFKLDASAFLTDSRSCTFGAADLGGLVLLMSRAWLDGSIPSDHRSLASLSRLGAAWESSRLAASIGLFFRRIEDRLVSIDLEGQLANRARVSEARVVAGRRGGARKALAYQLPSNCLAIARQLLGQGTEGAKTDETDTVQPPEVPVPALGTVKCTIFDPPATCQVDAHPSAEIIPPVIPLYTDSSFSSFDGGAGEGGSCENAKQVDLFGTPIKAPGKPRKATPTSEDREAASLIVDAYMEEVGPLHRRTIAADRNVALWLAEGVTVAEFRTAIRNFARLCDKSGRDPLYRNAPHNFFGRQNPFWRSHLKGPDETPGKPRNNGPAGRIRTGKSYEGIGVSASSAPHDASAPADAPSGQGTEHSQNPFRTPPENG
jgi:hypothetical protein